MDRFENSRVWEEQPDAARRRTLSVTVGALSGLGMASALWPFVASLAPSERALSAGGPVTFEIGTLQVGERITVAWRGKPVWILKRSPQMLAWLEDARLRALLRDPDSRVSRQQPAFAVNAFRSLKPELGVLVGLCTHLGCIPMFRPEGGTTGPGEFFCPCHGSRFDLSGRVYAGVPAPTNLLVPPYRFVGETAIEVGVAPGVT